MEPWWAPFGMHQWEVKIGITGGLVTAYTMHINNCMVCTYRCGKTAHSACGWRLWHTYLSFTCHLPHNRECEPVLWKQMQWHWCNCGARFPVHGLPCELNLSRVFARLLGYGFASLTLSAHVQVRVTIVVLCVCLCVCVCVSVFSILPSRAFRRPTRVISGYSAGMQWN